jgi:hypothetical protein
MYERVSRIFPTPPRKGLDQILTTGHFHSFARLRRKREARSCKWLRAVRAVLRERRVNAIVKQPQEQTKRKSPPPPEHQWSGLRSGAL